MTKFFSLNPDDLRKFWSPRSSSHKGKETPTSSSAMNMPITPAPTMTVLGDATEMSVGGCFCNEILIFLVDGVEIACRSWSA
ncbi:hypothetical protein AC579_1806 [Pseudocercospora musae]|uniref:Uncharacterized protein n=1 Tax=Pseudocercospora musae TaxID=113226 RepID=A0A139IDH5_9PEZI|nr:hypothetical protein AC579_1806 [Pseudocercospora musae]KXT12788.1 hypothetical protein AC579_1806 [Pseudocercospora musae]KXT12789.1 hypothetical protein AC579_1806 [Pseudocercospora musae]